MYEYKHQTQLFCAALLLLSLYMQYLSVFSHAAMEEEVVEISHSTVSLVLASQECLFRIALTALSQDTLLEAATFKAR